MFIRDSFRQDFYDVVRKSHVLIVVNNDVDGLCAARILMYLFSCDEVAYSLVPVTGWSMLLSAVEDYAEQAQCIVLINCGGNRSLNELGLSSDVKIFVIDSRRPFDLDNVYDGTSIRVLINTSELEELKCPAASEIYANDDDNTSDEDDGAESSRAIERIEQRAIKRARKKEWEKRRAGLLWEYYENSWYSVSSAVLLLEIAHSVGKSSSALMWCAVVGLNSQLNDSMISLEAYTSVCIERMRSLIRKYAPRDSSVSLKGDDILRISFEKDLPIPMYSHWSLYDSMNCHEFFITQAQLWQQRGEATMRHLLATYGLTLSECRQLFSAMEPTRRKEVFNILEKEMNYGFATFLASVGYCIRFSACDFARALSLRLEVGKGDSEEPYDRFSATMNILSEFLEGHGETSSLFKAVESYKIFSKNVISHVFASINQSHVLSTGSFFLLCMPQTDNFNFMLSRHCAFYFSNLLLKVFCSASRTRYRMLRPLVIAFPLSGDNTGWLLVTGVMPYNTEYADLNTKSFIGRAFDRVIERQSSIQVRQEHFDPSMILVKEDDRTRFFNGLQAILETVS
ncbi:hypothetical protein AB6A40_007082 [Gnathostoma spinigerum]|uniref:CDC45-like protein n=1 Tax=Gnathostoma spinigerum TaxID=75299 RepID=A0ABD6EKG7_9BILA